MDNNPDSVYSLITKLCEKFKKTYESQNTTTSYDLKAIRAKCFEILLHKTHYEIEDQTGIDKNLDTECHLLAWELQLITKYNLPKHAKNLKACYEKLQRLNVFNNPALCNFILFMLKICQVPAGEESIMERTLSKEYTDETKFWRSSTFGFFDEQLFHLPKNEFSDDLKYESESFKLNKKKMVFRSTCKSITEFFEERYSTFDSGLKIEDENLQSQNVSSGTESIWDLALAKPLGNYRNWESFGCVSPKKEPPFLTEAGPHATLLLHDVSCQLEKLLVTNYKGPSFLKTIISQKLFVKHVKYILVDIQSTTFNYNSKGELQMVPNTYLEGLTLGAIESYCKDFIFCGICYKGLNNLSSKNTAVASNLQNGYIFTELCESIKSYLVYYRLAVLSMPDSTNLFVLHDRTKQLRTYVTVLASICKVGPFTESIEIPHGIALLNYLYHQVMSLTNTDTVMVLYSILYRCCRVYFSRFLKQWILDGCTHDPYEEFFINVNPKYIATRGRTYWTRAYTLRDDIVPDFIAGFCSDILLCGKSMNLLKLCVPNSPLSLYIMDRKPDVISCCLMPQQLSVLEQNNCSYYLEATALCGPRISLTQIVNSERDQNDARLNLIAKKRIATLNRITLEKKKNSEIQLARKQEEIQLLRQQYAEAIKLKELRKVEEFEENLKIVEKNIQIQTLHDQIIQEESNGIIEFYNKLYKTSESRRLLYENRIKELKKVEYESTLGSPPISTVTLAENQSGTSLSLGNNSEFSETSSLSSKDSESKSNYVLATTGVYNSSSDITNTESYESLDIINANSIDSTDTLLKESEDKPKNINMMISAENFEMARKNKAKVLSLEMGITFHPIVKARNLNNTKDSNLTEAQRNKLRVMSSEFDMVLSSPSPIDVQSAPTIVQINRSRMMTSNECFNIQTNLSTDEVNQNTPKCDNDNFLVGKNFENVTTDSNKNLDVKKWATKKQGRLSLDLTKVEQKENDSSPKPRNPKFEFEKISPMSVDSAPLSTATTPSNQLVISFEKTDYEAHSASDTATELTTGTALSEGGFCFEIDKAESVSYFEKRKSVYNIQNHIENRILDKGISAKDAKTISNNCLEVYLQQSVLVPLITQMKLVTNELLRFFINDLHYLQHLNSLRNYFFLLDGEFARNITESLFEKLYDVNFPLELINSRTLKVLVYKALDYSTKSQDSSMCLSFRINKLPKIFELGDPDVLECISLTYKTTWPLNILLPSDTITKYDEVFKFLLKLHRVSWVLQNIFQDLKSLVKETEFNKLSLMRSPQYQRLHQCRHIMTHFIQTLQSYVFGEVLHTSWDIFEKNLEDVTNLDELYALHTAYIKNILFMCLLNQKSAPLRKVLQKIFIVIFKFYDYLRSRSWCSVNGIFTHPNFKKLEDIFNNFQDLVMYLFKVGHKVVKCGYQPPLEQLLDMLNINDYYSKGSVPNLSFGASSN